MKNIHKLKGDLTVEEKKCIVTARNNLISEARKTRETLKDMKIKEKVERNENSWMVQEYLQKHYIDLKNTCDEISKLLVKHVLV